jgi:hypothetical protein
MEPTLGGPSLRSKVVDLAGHGFVKKACLARRYRRLSFLLARVGKPSSRLWKTTKVEVRISNSVPENEERTDDSETLLIDTADPSRDGWLLGGPSPERHVVAGDVVLQQVLHQLEQALPGISLDVRHMLGHARREFLSPVVHEARHEVVTTPKVPVEASRRHAETPDEITNAELRPALSSDDLQGGRKPLLSGESFSPHGLTVDSFTPFGRP